MSYRVYLMQMAQRGKVIKTGGTLRIMNQQPYIKRSFSGSTGVYSGGTVRKLILDRLDNGIEPLTTSVSTLTIGKKYRRKTSKKASKKQAKEEALKENQVEKQAKENQVNEKQVKKQVKENQAEKQVEKQVNQAKENQAKKEALDH